MFAAVFAGNVDAFHKYRKVVVNGVTDVSIQLIIVLNIGRVVRPFVVSPVEEFITPVEGETCRPAVVLVE